MVTEKVSRLSPGLLHNYATAAAAAACTQVAQVLVDSWPLGSLVFFWISLAIWKPVNFKGSLDFLQRACRS